MSRDIALLHPTLRVKAEQLIAKAKAAGIDIIISQTLRSKAEQDELYAQGRTKPGNIVTQAKYPQSLHNWGVAFDIAVVINGKANWDTNWYQKIGPIGESLGLVWGGRWQNFPDLPHYELPGYSWIALQKQYGSPEAFIKMWKEATLPVSNVPTINPVTIQVGGQTIKGVEIGGHTLAPVRAIAEALGKEVTWDAARQTVVIK